ncbi:hypothetical protein FHX75_13377 [Micromonospora palomenae]|uniref:Signal transduction histidine kinase n=1 Tax=Micromonospora palomenae TaxID=1461247 RepID=A0A561VP07_9ACTN|nr:hypothetical protein [Micromonospora palomenae]TWG13340.1 hypothetical protein FHX75_13377 [Micromonospora palomenae]
MSADLDAGPVAVPRVDPSPASLPPPDDVPAVDVASASDRGARIAAVAIALVWHAVIGLPALLGSWSELAAPAVVAAGWLVVAATGGYAGARLLGGARPPALPLVAVLLAVDAAVFAASGRELLFTAANWVWGTLGWFFVVVLWGRRIPWLLALLAAHSLIALTALLGHGATAPADLTRYAMYVYGTSSLPIAVFTGAAVIAGLARQRAATAAAALAVAAERDAAERARRERQARLALVSGAAEEVLAELADGRADPADPLVQRRCVLAAARLRRLIAESDDVPDPLLHELRAAADLAERNGLPIDLVAIGTPPPLPVEVRRWLVDPPTAALAEARRWARLTVVAGPDEVVVSLVAPEVDDSAGTGPPSHVEDDGLVEHVQERDGEIRWTQTRWRRT